MKVYIFSCVMFTCVSAEITKQSKQANKQPTLI
jgi:hypothetical protein